MKKSLRIVVIAMSIIMILGIASTAFASSTTFKWKKVYGGPSQAMCTMARQRNYNIEQKVTGVTWHGQGGWKLRGYNQATGASCTTLTSITGANSFLANFTHKPTNVVVKNSISSTSLGDYLEWNGTIYT